MKILTLFLLLCVTPLSAKILEAIDLEPIKSLVDSVSEKDLVAFDVSHTLILEEDEVLRPCRKRCLRQLFALLGVETQERAEKLMSIIALERKVRLVDETSPQLIDALQSKGAHVIALTAMKTGELGLIKSTQKWRAKELQEFGFDFRGAFPEIHSFTLDNLPHPTSPPVYEQGVLCASFYPKGVVLQSFLKKAKFHPRRVIFIDNSLAHLKSVEAICNLMEIPFLGLYYKAWTVFQEKQDESIAEFQINYLLKNERWLSDQEAQHKLFEEVSP